MQRSCATMRSVYAVAPAAMAKKSLAFRLAPPTNAPSMFSHASSSAALSGLTLPPY